MLPFTSREDVDFFVHLEMYLRQENPPLCGRDHLAFRSAYFPVKDVVDGDLCEQYAQVRPPDMTAWLRRICHEACQASCPSLRCGCDARSNDSALPPA